MSKTLKVFSGLFTVVILIKVFDVFKNLVIASILGVSTNADIYTALVNIPESIVVVLGLDTIRGVVNSEYAHLYARGEMEKIWTSFKNLFSFLFWISLVIVIILVLLNEYVVDILLPGFTGEKNLKAAEVAYFIFPIFFFKVLIGYYHSVYNAVKRFFFPVVTPVIIGVFLLISVYLPYYRGDIIFNLSLANLAGNAVLLAMLITGLVKAGGWFKIGGISLDPLSKKVLKGCLSILLLVICNQLYLFSRNFFASFYGDGAISSLHYAGTLTSVIISLIFATFFTVLISSLSSIFSSDFKIKARRLFLNTLTGMIFAIIPVVIIFIVCNKELLSLVYLRGNFSAEGIEMTSRPFFWESLALFTFVLYNISTTLYLAKKEYALLTIIGSIVYISGIFFNYIFSSFFGYYGISMAGFVTTGIYGILLLYYSRKMIGRYYRYTREIGYLIISGIASFAAVWFIKESFFGATEPGLFSLLKTVLITGAALTAVYLAFTTLLTVNYITKLKEIYISRKG
jgi:putative peptidoglycan lipid II flippase